LFWKVISFYFSLYTVVDILTTLLVFRDLRKVGDWLAQLVYVNEADEGCGEAAGALHSRKKSFKKNGGEKSE
jgi:hypothetical protein